MKKILVLIMLICTGCSQADEVQIPASAQELENLTVYPVDEEPARQIHLVRDRSFGDTENLIFGRMSEITVDDHDRVFIADLQENRVSVFLSNGDYLASVGRTGDGPGEARQTVHAIVRANRLYVYDLTNRRINIFTIPDGMRAVPEFSHAVSLTDESDSPEREENHLPASLHSVRMDGSFLIYSRTSPLIYREDPDARGTVRYYLLKRDDTVTTDIILEQDQPGHIVTEWFIIPPPFTGRGLMTVTADDRIFSAWSDDFLIMEHNPDGSYRRSFYRPITKRRLYREEAVNSVDDHEQLHQAVRNMDLPETWPALHSILADDENRLWVSTITDDDESYEWWVLEDTGELIARFTWPRNRTINVIKNGNLYTFESSEETGLREVVRYRIDML